MFQPVPLQWDAKELLLYSGFGGALSVPPAAVAVLLSVGPRRAARHPAPRGRARNVHGCSAARRRRCVPVAANRPLCPFLHSVLLEDCRIVTAAALSARCGLSVRCFQRGCDDDVGGSSLRTAGHVMRCVSLGQDIEDARRRWGFVDVSRFQGRHVKRWELREQNAVTHRRDLRENLRALADENRARQVKKKAQLALEAERARARRVYG
jgi:hypothetical protein